MKKILSLILAVILCAGCLTACDSDSSGSSSSEKATTTTTKNTTTTTTMTETTTTDIRYPKFNTTDKKEAGVLAAKNRFAEFSPVVIDSVRETSYSVVVEGHCYETDKYTSKLTMYEFFYECGVIVSNGKSLCSEIAAQKRKSR